MNTDEFFGLRLRPWLDEAQVEPRIKVDVAEADTAYNVKAEIRA
jgi:hypothetical protein